MPHDFYYLRKWLSAKFYQRHLIEVEEDDPEAKKQAEIVFQKRGVKVSTILCISATYGSSLMAEVSQRQDEYRKKPDRKYCTRERYPYYDRGGDGSEKKRARFRGLAYMQYKVVNEDNRGVYKIDHLNAMLPTRVEEE
jgi:hypothetical protein